MKYKELPAFETNEFQVNDYVIYYSYFVRKGLVSNLHENPVYLLVAFENSSTKEWVHFKACRRLEEIKPREFYIDTNKKYNGLYGTANYAYDNKTGADFIKVREVLED